MRFRHRGHFAQIPAGISRRSNDPYLGRRSQFSTSHPPGRILDGLRKKFLDYSLPAPCPANDDREQHTREEANGKGSPALGIQDHVQRGTTTALPTRVNFESVVSNSVRPFAVRRSPLL